MTTSELELLPPIPQKKYFTIGEVSKLCAIKAHVLRYWEQEFPHLNPGKRRGNRRYYQAADIVTIREIRSLLYKQGFTIAGAKQNLLSHTQTIKKPLNDGIIPLPKNSLLAELDRIINLLK